MKMENIRLSTDTAKTVQWQVNTVIAGPGADHHHRTACEASGVVAETAVGGKHPSVAHGDGAAHRRGAV